METVIGGIHREKNSLNWATSAATLHLSGNGLNSIYASKDGSLIPDCWKKMLLEDNVAIKQWRMETAEGNSLTNRNSSVRASMFKLEF